MNKYPAEYSLMKALKLTAACMAMIMPECPVVASDCCFAKHIAALFPGDCYAQ